MKLKLVPLVLFCVALSVPEIASAATVGVITPTRTSLTNNMLPYATGGYILGSTAVQQSGLTNLLIPGYITLGGTTNRISDDGSDLTRNGVAIGGGGDTIWTNISGIIQPLSGQTTNRLSFTSGASDNATNEAVRIGTAVNWTVDDEEKLLSLHHNGTNVAWFTASGSLETGKGTVDYWFPDSSDVFVGGHSSVRGENPLSYLYVYALDDPNNPTNIADLSFSGNASTGNSIFNTSASSGANFTVARTRLTPTTAKGTLEINASEYTRLEPSMLSSGTAVPYLLDTVQSMTNGDSILLVQNAGVTRARIDGNSGYTGAGTLFLSDDGTYKLPAVAAGANIWTNVSGTIQPLSGQTTNRLSFTSGAADDPTNIVAVLDTSAAWTTANRLLSGRNGGTEFISISRDGGILLGPDSEAFWGELAFDGPIFRSYHDATAGDASSTKLSWWQHSATPSDAHFDFIADSVNTKQDLVFFDTNNDIVSLVASDGNSRIQLTLNGTVRTAIIPGVASTGSAVAYDLGTKSTLTNGDSILLVRNNGVTHGRIAGNSGYGGAGTKFLTDDGTYQTASSSATITYTNQFVFNAKVTYNSDVYVTNATIYINGTDVRTEAIQAACSDETTALTVGTAKVTFRMPYAMTLTAVRASLTAAQASGSIFTVDINEAGATVISTKITIDNTEKTSTTAATPPVISDSALADDAEITVDIDQVGDGTATGLKIALIGLRLP